MYLTSAKTENVLPILFLSPLELNQKFKTLRHDITDIIK